MENQKRHLPQFFTPEVVVRFMFDLVGFNPLWKVMDPACGDGIFLKEALKRGAGAVAGVDIDLEAIEAARENLREFEGRFRLFCQDGLAEIECQSGFWKEHYDLVIGNPPFASSKYRVREKRILQHFTLAQMGDTRRTMILPGLEKELHPLKPRPSQVIEVLFLERFIQLARPGGKVAIILPEGIFANSNLRYVREWLVEHFTILAVIGLPRNTFKGTGTTAKTAILYLEKRKPPPNHKVVLAEVTEINLDSKENPQLAAVLGAFQKENLRTSGQRVEHSDKRQLKLWNGFTLPK